jgi:hypothetical protein
MLGVMYGVWGGGGKWFHILLCFSLLLLRIYTAVEFIGLCISCVLDIDWLFFIFMKFCS